LTCCSCYYFSPILCVCVSNHFASKYWRIPTHPFIRPTTHLIKMQDEQLAGSIKKRAWKMAKDDWNEIDLENRRPPSVQSPDFFGRRWSVPMFTFAFLFQEIRKGNRRGGGSVFFIDLLMMPRKR
jgi:hypothetical protein